MNALPKNNNKPEDKRRLAGNPRLKFVILALVFFLAGVALSAFWFSRPPAPVASDSENPVALSEATKAVLQHLDSPVEIRFYSMLAASGVPDSVQAYAGRAGQLLAQYEQVAGGKVRVVRCDSLAEAGANAAEADGISAFNMDKGDACFLGIAVVCGNQKESLPRLAPEWEQALEPDLTRALARAAAAKQGAPSPARIDSATLEAVRRSIPNFDAVSLQEGTQVLREAGRTQFQQATVEIQAQVKEARQRFLQAQAGQSEAAQQAAREQLRRVQSEAADRLKQIALNSHLQIAALQQIKQTAP